MKAWIALVCCVALLIGASALGEDLPPMRDGITVPDPGLILGAPELYQLQLSYRGGVFDAYYYHQPTSFDVFEAVYSNLLLNAGIQPVSRAEAAVSDSRIEDYEQMMFTWRVQGRLLTGYVLMDYGIDALFLVPSAAGFTPDAGLTGLTSIVGNARQAGSQDSAALIAEMLEEVRQQQIQLDEQMIRLNEQQLELDKATITLTQKEKELEEANATLVGKQKELAAIQIQLDQQESDLHAAQSALKTKEDEQALLQLQLNTQADALAAMQTVLDSQRAEMLAYQQKIDAMIGVRTKIIQELTRALNAANLGASVDPVTGDITLGSAMLFDINSPTIKDDGRALLARFLPVYLEVLMRPEYESYVGEIIIEGHTDDQGSYMSNLKLSQNRALSVAEFCLTQLNLSSRQATKLQSLLTAKGRSYTDLIYNPDGTVNKDASRRVEFKFRLKDSEMIQQMNQILSQME